MEVIAVGNEPAVVGLLFAHGLGHYEHPLPPADREVRVVFVAGPAHAARGFTEVPCMESKRIDSFNLGFNFQQAAGVYLLLYTLSTLDQAAWS